MSTDHISEFEESLLGSATSERTTAANFEDVLWDHVEHPAIGVSLPFEGVSLPEGIDPPKRATDLETAETGVTPGGVGVADYGTVSVRSDAEGAELVALYPKRHIAVVAASDIAGDMDGAFDRLAADFEADRRTHVLETGPSATADMGSLVEGVHGPTEVHVLILEDR